MKMIGKNRFWIALALISVILLAIVSDTVVGFRDSDAAAPMVVAVMTPITAALVALLAIKPDDDHDPDDKP